MMTTPAPRSTFPTYRPDEVVPLAHYCRVIHPAKPWVIAELERQRSRHPRGAELKPHTGLFQVREDSDKAAFGFSYLVVDGGHKQP